MKSAAIAPRIALGLRLERFHHFREAGYGALVFEATRRSLRTPHDGRVGVLTAGADVDLFASRHVSIRPAATFHLTQTSDGSMPWIIWRSGVGMAVHW